jgi:hypothetical protein
MQREINSVMRKEIQLLFIVMISTFICNSIFAQEKKKWPDIAISPGIIAQRQAFGELNVLIGRYESSTGGNAFGGVRIGAESNFKSGSDQIFAPKIGVELSGLIVCMRATALTYFYNGDVQFRLLPELGISFLGFANLTYGYNFNLSKVEINGISNHRICLSINLNRNLINDAFGLNL